MGYISVLASFVPPRSGGVFPFSYNHYHHDITSRLIGLFLLLLNVIVTYIYYGWDLPGSKTLSPTPFFDWRLHENTTSIAKHAFRMTIIGGDQNGTFECPMQNAYFFQEFHWRLDESTTFASNLAWIGLLPPGGRMSRIVENCTHSRVLA